VALGALVGRSEYQLEVLKDSNAEAVARGRRFVDEGRISIRLEEEDPDKLYISALCRAAGHEGEAVIKGRAMAQSRQRYILCTAEKFQIVSPVRFADFADATVITDHCPDSWYEQQRNVVVAP
jgi:hypothetical protein